MAGTTVDTLVLGGGGMMGLNMAGALCALQQAGMWPVADTAWCGARGALPLPALRLRRVVGTSVGSLIGLGLVLGWTPAKLARRMLDTQWNVALGTLRYCRSSSGLVSLLDDAPLRDMIAASLAEVDLPADITLGELARARGVTLDVGVSVLREGGPATGELWTGRPGSWSSRVAVADAIAASCALPGLLPAVMDPWQRVIVDGGVTASLCTQGCDPARTLVVHCNTPQAAALHGASRARMSALAQTVLRGRWASSQQLLEGGGFPYVINAQVRADGETPVLPLSLTADRGLLHSAVADGFGAGAAFLRACASIGRHVDAMILLAAAMAVVRVPRVARDMLRRLALPHPPAHASSDQVSQSSPSSEKAPSSSSSEAEALASEAV